MKKILFLLLAITLNSCGGNEISEEQIKTDLIGTSISGAWNFDMPSEFLDIRILDEKDTGGVKEITTEFILKGLKEQSPHYLLASLIYKKDDGDWKYIKGNQLFYKKNHRFKFNKHEPRTNEPKKIAKEVIRAIFDEDYGTIYYYYGNINRKAEKGIEFARRNQLVLKNIEVLETNKEQNGSIINCKIKTTVLKGDETENDDIRVRMGKTNDGWKVVQMGK